MGTEEKNIEIENKLSEAWKWFDNECKKLKEKYPYKKGMGIDSHMKDYKKLGLELEDKINKIKRYYNIL